MRSGESCAVTDLAIDGRCSYSPFDWATLSVSDTLRAVSVDRPVFIEGVSSLHPKLCPHYALAIFVDSDRASTLPAALARGVGLWADGWRDWFLPSADLYFGTRPELRADIGVPGRGLSPQT